MNKLEDGDGLHNKYRGGEDFYSTVVVVGCSAPERPLEQRKFVRNRLHTLRATLDADMIRMSDDELMVHYYGQRSSAYKVQGYCALEFSRNGHNNHRLKNTRYHFPSILHAFEVLVQRVVEEGDYYKVLYDNKGFLHQEVPLLLCASVARDCDYGSDSDQLLPPQSDFVPKALGIQILSSSFHYLVW